MRFNVGSVMMSLDHYEVQCWLSDDVPFIA